MSESQTGSRLGRKSLIARCRGIAGATAAGLVLGGCASGSGGGGIKNLEIISAAPTPDQLTNAYTSCEVSFDSEGFSVIESGEPNSRVRYTVKAEKNPDVVNANVGIAYKGLFAEISDDSVTQDDPGTIEWKDEGAGVAIHELPSINVYGPGSVAYNIYAVAEGDLDSAETGVYQSYRYCGTVAITGHTNHGLTDVQPVEPFRPTDGVPNVELRPAA